MGSLGSRNCLLLVFFTLGLLLLVNVSQGQDSCSEEESGVEIFEKDVTANFGYILKESLYFQSNSSASTTYWTLPPESLTISTVSLHEGPSCRPCIRINISVNASGLPKLRGFFVQGLEISENTFHSFRIVKKKNWKIRDLWEVTYDCWIVTPGQNISVSLFTLPNFILPFNKTHYIPSRDAKPAFQYQHIAEEKKFEVSVPKGPHVIARLCYDFYICEDLEPPSEKEISSSQIVSLSYENLLPCLCIEAFYTHRDSKREKKCPFKDHPEPYIEKLLQVSVNEINHPSDTMTVRFSSPCPLETTVTFCRKQNGICVTEKDAIVKQHGKEYYLKSVDRDHHLCFQFSSLNRSYVKCPDIGDRFWNMNLKTRLYSVLITISSKISASFSAAVCRKNLKTGGCDLRSVIYNVSTNHKFGSDDLQLSLPRPGIGDCIMVWRSDVSHSHRYLLCSFDFSHQHLGLLALVTSLVIFTMILIIYRSCQRMWKIFTAPLWRRTILLVYSPDSAEYKTLICDFADFLHSILGCEVILDLWDMNTVSQIGMLPWFYQKRKLVSERKGKVMVVWTRRSRTMYDQWKKRQTNSIGWKDSTNLFGAAMSCLEKDLGVQQERENLKHYTMVYFEGLCERKDIPECLQKISTYRLLKDLYRLVSHLQDTTCLSPPCLIKAVAKYLKKKLISSEKKKGFQHHVEICKKKLGEDVS
ncbi:interleukin-17 receptor E [Anomaloglossus baeobatrachus]|uniref:interleukin-17 receptor E n=1 Tax=Anomaloglossus baeobatrachus TaxID=238106 RepID=UPI003F4F43E2